LLDGDAVMPLASEFVDALANVLAI